MNSNGKKFISLEDRDKLKVIKSVTSIFFIISVGVICITAIVIGDKYSQYSAIMTLMCPGPFGAIIITEEAEYIKRILNKTTLR